MTDIRFQSDINKYSEYKAVDIAYLFVFRQQAARGRGEGGELPHPPG